VENAASTYEAGDVPWSETPLCDLTWIEIYCCFRKKWRNGARIFLKYETRENTKLPIAYY